MMAVGLVALAWLVIAVNFARPNHDFTHGILLRRALLWPASRTDESRVNEDNSNDAQLIRGSAHHEVAEGVRSAGKLALT